MARPVKNLPYETTKQSNYITTARYDYSPQEKRILYRVVEKAFEFRLKNADFFKNNEGKYQVTKPVEFTMQITDFMNNEQKKEPSGRQYLDVVDAFKALVDKRISFRGKGEFAFGGIVNYAFQNKGQGSVTFNVHQFVWQSALDFSLGFTKMDLITAMQFKSAYSMRFYEFAKKWIDKEYWICTMEEFREMFGCQEKYPNTADMIRYIIDVAKKELDEVSPISFTYTKRKAGRNIKDFTFRFYEVTKNKTEEQHTADLIVQYPNAALSRETKDFLINKLSLTPAELNHNIRFFHDFESTFRNKTIIELEETFQYISKMKKRPQDNKGLFIQNLRKKLEWEQRQQDIPFNTEGQNTIQNIFDELADKFRKY